GRSCCRQGSERLREHQVLPRELPRALRRPLRLGHSRAAPKVAHGDGRGRHRMAAVARPGARLPPLAALGSQGVLGRQGRRGTRHEAERALQAADLRDVPGRPRRDVAHPVLRRGAPPVGLGLSASRQRLAQLASGDRAADAAPVAGDAPQADSRQCRGALRAGRMRPLFSVTVLVLLISAAAAGPAAAAPDGQMTWGVHISLAPTWFDPAETPGIVTPFMVLYGLHDAMLKALPGNPLAPALAESWTVSPDGLTYEFVLRRGVKFHNGEPVTAEDVKFSFERYRGSANKTLKERIAAVETPDPGRVRFRLKQPWPDFVLFYSTATGAGWIVPKKYVEKVGDEGFKKAPIGAGPYRFVSFKPGVELVMEAFEGYWRKTPSVKRLVLRVIPG